MSMADNPEALRRELVPLIIRESVESLAVMICDVECRDDDTERVEFAFTVGLASNHPETFVFGASPHASCVASSGAGRCIRSGERFVTHCL
ncbi:hypothetical protein TGVAND_437320 [Toxoplasma gondii VAND]|uniref:Uncharacterized protein n=1 Tax=Toxoplasma gondii VAND TaxID=933077 RepID=A0A086PW30_TOXGO|nr:hypothetical protein TGVAND_437320 [Toxoplasma gondii VAND]